MAGVPSPVLHPIGPLCLATRLLPRTPARERGIQLVGFYSSTRRISHALGRGFIKNVEIVAAAPHLAQLSGKLHALRFAAGENCRRVTEFQIAQTEFVKDFELPHYRALILKDTNAFLDREL